MFLVDNESPCGSASVPGLRDVYKPRDAEAFPKSSRVEDRGRHDEVKDDEELRLFSSRLRQSLFQVFQPNPTLADPFRREAVQL